MIYLSQLLLYLCFSLLVGQQVLSFVAKKKQPIIQLSTSWIQLSVVGIIILSFIPIIHISWLFSSDSDISFWSTFLQMVSDSEMGQAAMITLIFGLALLFTFHWKEKWLNFALILILVIAQGWASHAAASDHWQGWLLHTIHFLAVTIWIGTLFVVSWFSRNKGNWISFLNWFTPLALLCVLVLFGTGFILMNLLVPSYTESLSIPYGQALLIKHLLIIPLLTFAMFNGVWARKKVRTNPHFQPLSWLRAESVVALLVFTAMAVMGQQSPPKEIMATIQLIQSASPY